MGHGDPRITFEQLVKIGVRWVSIGAGLSRVALNVMITAAQAMKDSNFEFIHAMIGVSDLRKAFGEI
jgi:2-methylisocitrate lyase-like PEP mutase family enzyme